MYSWNIYWGSFGIALEACLCLFIEIPYFQRLTEAGFIYIYLRPAGSLRCISGMRIILANFSEWPLKDIYSSEAFVKLQTDSCSLPPTIKLPKPIGNHFHVLGFTKQYMKLILPFAPSISTPHVEMCTQG